MPICPKCNREMPIVRFNSLVSDLCEECYEKEQYGKSRYPMPKRFVEQTVVRSTKAQTTSEIWDELNDYWGQLLTSIQKQGKDEGYLLAYVIQEISPNDAFKSFIETGSVTLRCGYFFTNNRFDCSPTFEDRGKQCSMIAT